MRQIIKNHEIISEIKKTDFVPEGNSAAPKGIIFHILEDKSQSVDVLDIGFGSGSLGIAIKSEHTTSHWNVDGVDGWAPNCENESLFQKNIYRNIWHGLVQEIPSEQISRYKIVCLLDIIEHLNAETAKWILRTLLSNLGDDSYLFVSTPLWFYPQTTQQEGDLEEHLIGVPASSMLALLPIMYSINHPLVGGFVYSKRSLKYIEMFHPCSDKNFSYEMGLNIVKALNIQYSPGVLYKTGL